jgi:hypothetical protein
MPNDPISVKLVQENNQWLLDVVDHGQIDVHKNPQPTKIVWKLEGILANGQFAGMGGTEPGFQWEEQPPPGIFSEPQLTTQNKHLEMIDNHTDADSKGGPWIYKLRVVDGNNVYTTSSKYDRGLTQTAKDPVIVNKDP